MWRITNLPLISFSSSNKITEFGQKQVPISPHSESQNLQTKTLLAVRDGARIPLARQFQTTPGLFRWTWFLPPVNFRQFISPTKSTCKYPTLLILLSLIISEMEIGLFSLSLK